MTTLPLYRDLRAYRRAYAAYARRVLDLAASTYLLPGSTGYQACASLRHACDIGSTQ